MTEQPQLFETEPERMVRTAVLSDDERYRYLLGREWADGPTAVVIMLNPSTADHQQDDPTIRRLTGENGFARRWGCGALLAVNLYAWRATQPTDLWRADDPVGPENDAYLYAAADIAASTDGPIVAAWGTNARADRIAAVLELPGMDRLSALTLTKGGQPAHPLYLRSDLTPRPWSPT